MIPASAAQPLTPLGDEIWRTKYRFVPADGSVPESSIADTWARVAAAVAAAEREKPDHWRARFIELLASLSFLPGGRIIAGAGAAGDRTLVNCFVMGFIEDSLHGILNALRESAVTMQWGGGIGVDFSTLRPRGARSASHGTGASGPATFMRIWDTTAKVLSAANPRRSAMMATLRCDHPDILEFVDAKLETGALSHFNLSVQISDTFMRAVATDADWPLIFPATDNAPAAPRLDVHWPAAGRTIPCSVHATLPARTLWQRIVDAAHRGSEPGLLFVDRINGTNNLGYCEEITTTNPCGEVPLPSYGACVLGSLNLTAFVRAPFTDAAAVDTESLAAAATTAVRFLDNVIDISRFPLPQQQERAQRSRRIGLGITGLADALVMLGHAYDSDAGRAAAIEMMTSIRNAAYAASTELARERGPFPDFDRDSYLARPFIESLPGALRDGISTHGIRNSHLLAVAPAGSISLLAGNVSSGIEPIFALEHDRKIRTRDGDVEVRHVDDYGYRLWQQQRRSGAALPPAFRTARELSADAHLLMQAGLQQLVDNSIAKTVNLAADTPPSAIARLFERAYELDLKGCTVFRSRPDGQAVLMDVTDAACAASCDDPV